MSRLFLKSFEEAYMVYVLALALRVLVLCMVWLVFILVDMYEEWDFYNGYWDWYEAQDPKPLGFLDIFSDVGGKL